MAHKNDITKNPLAALAVSPVKTFMQMQQKGESICLLIRKHIVTNLGWSLFFVILLIVPFIVFSEFGREILNTEAFIQSLSAKTQVALVVLWYLISFLYALQNALLWFFNVLIVTNERVIDLDVTWPFHRHVTEAHISQVQDVSFKQGGFIASILNYGNIFVQTAGETQGIEITQAPNPALIHDIITDLVEAAITKNKTV